jgi:hypothetical protein
MSAWEGKPGTGAQLLQLEQETEIKNSSSASVCRLSIIRRLGGVARHGVIQLMQLEQEAEQQNSSQLL